MFDITSSKLLILGIVALLVIGPKDLPALLRTIGKYVGMIKKQAAEFRAQFDEAMRESELHELKKEVESIQHETETAMRDAGSSVEKQLADARESVDVALGDAKPAAADPMAHDADGLLGPQAAAGIEAPGELNGTAHPAETPTPAAGEVAAVPAPSTPGESDRAPEKSGA
jgi:sec-independent protein translocase protein TatB